MNKKVEEFYDSNPYPAVKPGMQIGISRNTIQNDFMLEGKKVPSKPKILIAGCGTVAPEAIAKAYPDAAIICAVDISSKVLEIAEKRLSSANKGKVLFIKGDIAEKDFLNQLPENQFDWIHCTGVLHHLAEPLYGISNISKLLADDGVMRLQLYSKGGRTWIEWARKLFLQKNAENSGHIRVILTGLSKHHPFKHTLATYPESLNTAGLRDGFLHSQVNTFYAQEWQEMFNSCGLKIGIWNNLHYLADIGTILPERFLDKYNNLDSAKMITIVEKLGEWRSDFKALAIKSEIVQPVNTKNSIQSDYIICSEENISYPRYLLWQNFKSVIKQFNTEISKDELISIIENLNDREWIPGLKGLILRLNWNAFSDRCKLLASPKYIFKSNLEMLIEDYFTTDEQLYIPESSSWTMEQWINGFYRWQW